MVVRNVVVVGGGVIGTATAFYLAKEGANTTVVEKCGVACHSSGKAGGFLAKDWNDGGPVGPLARASFDLHADLAKELGAEAIGYRRLSCIGVGFGDEAAEWLTKTNGALRQLGTPETTAQVTPRALTEALLEAARGRGCGFVIGTVTGMEISDGAVKAVKLADGSRIVCDAVVLAMGAWASDARAWFPRDSGIPQHSVAQKYTSVVYDQLGEPTAVFLESRHQVELYPRKHEVYVCGCPSTQRLPADPLAIVPEEGTQETIHAEVARCSPELASARVKLEQACFLPGSDDNQPVIGRLNNVSNGYIACGHTCWGILNAPGTGKALAQLIVHGDDQAVVDLKPFSPIRPASISRSMVWLL